MSHPRFAAMIATVAVAKSGPAYLKTRVWAQVVVRCGGWGMAAASGVCGNGKRAFCGHTKAAASDA